MSDGLWYVISTADWLVPGLLGIAVLSGMLYLIASIAAASETPAEEQTPS